MYGCKDSSTFASGIFSILSMKKIVFTSLCLLSAVILMAENVHEASLVNVNDTSRVIDLDEVIVIAQPKEGVLLRQQPMSSSAFGTREMQLLQTKSLGQLSDYVPSFVMPQYGSRLTSSMYIRGIGSRLNNSAVGIYYDHVPLMSKSAFNTHFLCNTVPDCGDALCAGIAQDDGDLCA